MPGDVLVDTTGGVSLQAIECRNLLEGALPAPRLGEEPGGVERHCRIERPTECPPGLNGDPGAAGQGARVSCAGSAQQQPPERPLEGRAALHLHEAPVTLNAPERRKRVEAQRGDELGDLPLRPLLGRPIPRDAAPRRPGSRLRWSV